MRVKIPRHFCKEAKELYEFVVKNFKLEPNHLNLLYLCCQARTRAEQARVEIDRNGLTTTDKYNRIVARPETLIEKNSMNTFARLLRELNLSESTPEEVNPPRLGYGGKQCR